MSKPSISVVADAVVAELNGRQWVQAFKAEREWIDRKTAEDLRDLQVRVMCERSMQSMFNRGYRQREHEINIVFRKTIDPNSQASVDALASFVEDVADYYGGNHEKNGLRKVAGTQAIVKGVMVDPIVNPDDLETNRRFYSVVTMTIDQVEAV